MSPPGGKWGGNLNFGHHHSIPTYSRTIWSKFHQNLRIFSKNLIPEKVTRYTGQLRGGRRGLTPPTKIVVLVMLIHMQVTGFALKSIVFELFAKVHFGSDNDKAPPPPPGGGRGALSVADTK